MAERVIKITVTAAVNSYLDGMDKVAKKAREGRSDAEALTAKVEAQKKAFNIAGTAMLAAGGLIAAGLILATKRAAEFDQAMSNVQAATHESASNMEALREAALEAGADTVYSAKEAAGAIEELAKAGVSTKDIIGGGLRGALDLAAASGMDVADAAGIAATTLGQFQLTGDKASHVADLLAAGAGKAMGDVSDLGMALGQAGTVASSFGISIEDTTGSLAAFASKGLLGSDAGTSLRAMLLRLANPTGEAADKMKELGIQAYDASGQFIGMEGLAGQLEKGLSGLTQEQKNAALAIIFGQDAIRSANILYEEGADGIADWVDKVDDAGYAAETAATRLDNLNGDLEKLGGAFDTLLISLGDSGQGPLRAIVQGITELVDSFNDLPDGAKAAAYWVGAAASAAALAGGTFLLAVPKIAAYRVAVQDLGPAAQRVSGIIGGLTKALGIAALIGATVVAFDQFESAMRTRLLPTTSELANALKTATSAKELFDKTLTVERNFELKPIITDVKELHSVLRTASAEGDNLFTWLNANTAFTGEGAKFTEFREGWQKLAEEMKAAPETIAPTFQKMRDEFGLTEAEIWRLIDLSEPLKQALTDQATAAGLSSDKASLMKLALEGAQPSIEDVSNEAIAAEQTLTNMKDALDGVSDTALSMSGALDNAQGSLNRMADAAEAEGTTIDGTNDSSIAFRDSIRDVEQSHRDAADAILKNGGTLDDAKVKYLEGRDAVIEMLKAKGLDQAAAEAWADANLGSAGEVVSAMSDVKRSVDNIPDKKVITLVADTAPAIDRLTRFINDWSGRQITVGVGVNGNVYSRDGGNTFYGYRGGVVEFMNRGGLTPMRSLAQMVPPNTWRVVGDRPDVPELFAPLDGSPRSWALLAEGFKRMPGTPPSGVQFMASGGFVQPSYVAQAPFWASGGSTGGGERVSITDNGTYYAYDPTDVARRRDEQLTRTLDAYGIR